MHYSRLVHPFAATVADNGALQALIDLFKRPLLSALTDSEKFSVFVQKRNNSRYLPSLMAVN